MQAITIQGHWGESLLNQEFLQKFLGKKVIVTIIEMGDLPEPPQKSWSLLGSLDLGGKLDNVNIRDFAHD